MINESEILDAAFTVAIDQNNQDILTEILEIGSDDIISWFAAMNPNCPASTLEHLLSRVNDDMVSHYASKNPNCPPKAKITWMMATGKIGKEDPNIHIIEEVDEKFDNDLEQLKKLVNKEQL